MTELSFLDALQAVISDRLEQSPDGSYTARLGQQGLTKVAQKLGEEAVELALAAVVESDDRVRAESADLLYHMLVLLKLRDMDLGDVLEELESRHTERDANATAAD